MWTINNCVQSRLYYHLARLDVTDSSRAKLEAMKWKLWTALFNSTFPDNAKRVFVENYDEVKRLVPKERLLEYEVSEGWERLCGFLGHDVHDSPFSRVNDTAAAFLQWRCFVEERAVKRAIKTVGPVVGGLTAAACAY